MQYLVASLLALLGLANSLQCAQANGRQNTWSGRPRVRLEVHPRIEEWPHHGPGKRLVLHKKNEPLNMTCTVVYQNSDKDDDTPFEYTVDWKGPRHVNNNPKIERGQSRNTAWIWFERLAEKDAGDYMCIAVSQKSWGHQNTLSVLFYLFVEHKPTYCGSQWFRCRSKNCIMERYVCDGKPDCEEGEDETSAAGCGPNPCLGKILCEDRCIPPEWCCDHRNCTGTFGLRPWPHENHEISYVQTAFYTVIGCALAFMFIVTILVIAICRVQIKRAMNSRCSQQNRNVICGRRAVPLYDLDVYLNRTADANYPGGVSIMYNINSGVQFVGRPTEPPPYSEVVAEPPREGPPPPYVSCENLIIRVANPRFPGASDAPEVAPNEISSAGGGRGMLEAAEASQPDTDIRVNGGTNANDREGSSVPGPQVPIHSCPPILGETELTYPRFAGGTYSRNDLDAESSRVQGAANFELEYVETDALLADNNSNSCGERSRSKEPPATTTTTIAWKPYTRHVHNLAKSRLSRSNEHGAKRAEKNWYGRALEKTPKEPSIRGTSGRKDSENEGVFLETDQPSPVETTSNEFSPFANGLEASAGGAAHRIESGTASGSNEATPITAFLERAKTSECRDHDRQTNDRTTPDSSLAETRRKKTEAKFLRANRAAKSENDRSAKKTSGSRNFLRAMKRQSSLTNEPTSPKNLGQSSARASTGSIGNFASETRLDNDEATAQIRQSSLVLPLRESFIGVQRDS